MEVDFQGEGSRMFPGGSDTNVGARKTHIIDGDCTSKELMWCWFLF